MDIKEICLLIAQLKKENETNSPEEKDFNLKWIEILKESIDKSINKSILITASIPTICGSVRRKAANVLFLSNSKNFTL